MGSQRGGGGGGGGGSLFFANSTSANLLGPPWGAEQPSGRLRSRKLVKGETLFPWSVGFQRAEREGLATAGLGTATPGAALRAAGRAPSSRRAGRGRSAAMFRGSLRSSALCPVGTAPNGSAGGGLPLQTRGSPSPMGPREPPFIRRAHCPTRRREQARPSRFPTCARRGAMARGR